MSKTPEERKAYRREWMAKKRDSVHKPVHTEGESVNKSSEPVNNPVNKTESVHKAMTFEKTPTAFPGVFTLKPVEVNVIDSDWHPSEVTRHNISQSIFQSCGVPTLAKDGEQYVLIAGSLDINLDGEIEPFCVVSAHDWHEGLERTCMHGLHGWSCKEC